MEVVEEGWRSGGIVAELAARVAEHAFWDLDAPVERVATAEVPIPYAKHLETAALPSVENVIEAPDSSGFTVASIESTATRP